MTMPELTIYGASDDLIEFEGAIHEEFNALGVDETEEEGLIFAVSDGTVLRIRYTEGVWRIAPVVEGSAALSVVQAPEDDEDNYSDVATLTGEAFKWVVLGTQIAVRKD